MDLPKNQVLSRVIGATVDRKEKLVSCQADKTGKRFSNFFGRSGSPPRKFASNSFLMEVLSFLVLLGNKRFRFFTKSAQRDSRS